MPFSAYKSLNAVIKEFNLQYVDDNYILEIEFTINDYFKTDWDFTIERGVVDNSEAAICENLIYPVLKEVCKAHWQKFVLWSHEGLEYDAILSGVPDYILTARSPLGRVVFDQPYLLVVEAKQDKFEEGWRQCLVEMVVAQRLNEKSDKTIFGIVSNGKVWQFGKLNNKVFTKNKVFYTIQDLDKLFAAVNYVFHQCELQLDECLEV